MSLNEEQLAEVRAALLRRGLTFEPLLNEMIDHIITDLEQRMAGGTSFPEAWNEVMNELSESQIKNIQQETMETINKRVTASRVLSVATLGLLLAAGLFKVLHLAGANVLLLSSLGALAASLSVSSVSGILLNRSRRGGYLVLAIMAGTIMMLAGVCFQLLHLPGSSQLIVIGVASLIAAIVLNSIYVYRHRNEEGNLLTFLHERHSPGIERFLLILLLATVVYRVVTLVAAPGEYFGVFVLVILIYGAGLQTLAISWRTMENDLSRRNKLNVVLMILSGTTLALPMLGQLLSLETRIAILVLHTFATAILVYRIDNRTTVTTSISFVVPLFMLFVEFSKVGWLPALPSGAIADVVIVSIFVAGIFLCRRGSISRSFLIASLAAFLVERPM